LDELSVRLGEQSKDLRAEMQTALPARIRHEIAAQQTTVINRIAGLEEQVEQLQSGGSIARSVASAVGFAVAAGLILCLVIIFERPLRNWGQDNLFPLFGVGITEAQRVQPPERRAPPLGQR